MSKLFCFLFLVGAIGAARDGIAQTFFTPLQVSRDATAHSPVMHIGRDGTIFIGWFEHNADISFSHSTDGGVTFSSPVRVSLQITTNNYTSLLQRAPNFAIDTKGTIHLVWMEARVPSPLTGEEQSDIWYVRSTDRGVTWTQPVSIMDADDSDLYAQDFPSIAIDSANNLYVCYIDNRFLKRGLVPHYKLMLERSTDGGGTWSDPVFADKLPFEDAGTCECCRTDIAASPQGHIYITFRTNMTESTGDKRDIFIARSMDGGRSFDSSIECQLGDWTLDACPTKGPQIALDKNENLHVAWADARDDSGKLVSYYSLLRNGDSAVFPNYSVSFGTPNATWPTLALAPDGTIAYAYALDFSGGPCRFSYSSDGGNTWSRAINFHGDSGDPQTIPTLAFDTGGYLCAAWQDAFASGILFSNISGLSKAQPPDTVTSYIQQQYLADQPIRLSWSRPHGMRTAPFVWYSFRMGTDTGAIDWGFVTRDTFYQFDSLPKGTYGYNITAHSIIGTSIMGGRFTVTALESVEKELTGQMNTEVYPNPVTDGVLKINALGTSTPVQITIFDERGSMVKRPMILQSAGMASVDVRDLAAGAYVCEVLGRSLRRIRFVIP